MFVALDSKDEELNFYFSVSLFLFLFDERTHFFEGILFFKKLILGK